MTSQGHGAHHGEARDESRLARIDDEIDRKGIAHVGIWLAVIAIASFAVVWIFYRGLSSFEKKTFDAKPSPLREANAPREPAGPLLQSTPERELAAFRHEEQQRLSGWGWVDRSGNVAHVPVDKAIEAVAAQGLPNFSSPAAPPSAGATP